MSHGKLGGQKIVIIGAGFVGTTFAYSLLIHGIGSEIVLIDKDRQRAEGEVMDLTHGVPFANPMRITAGDFPDCSDADIIVITVDKGQKIQQSRLELAQGNYELLRQIVPNIKRYNESGILLVVTNPLDVMTYAAMKLSGFPTNRVIGSGTSLDSARLRYLISEHVRVDARNVHAYIIGEHGDSEVPVWSLANVAGIRLRDFCPSCKMPYSQKQFDDLFLKVKNAAYEIISRKGKTNYAVALALTAISRSILRDENSVMTVSTLLNDYNGVSDICLSVPAVVNRQGIRETITLPLEPNERENFQKSASIVRNVAKSLGL